MAKRILRPFEFYSMIYNDGDFELQLVSEEYLPDVTFAKIRALSSFGFSEGDVPVFRDYNGNFNYYHFGYDTWFNSPGEEKLKKYFNFLIPKSEGSVDAGECNSNKNEV